MPPGRLWVEARSVARSLLLAAEGFAQHGGRVERLPRAAQGVLVLTESAQGQPSVLEGGALRLRSQEGGMTAILAEYDWEAVWGNVEMPIVGVVTRRDRPASA